MPPFVSRKSLLRLLVDGCSAVMNDALSHHFESFRYEPSAPIRLKVFEKGEGARERLGQSWQQGSKYFYIVSRESHSARQGLLDLLERLALCFRKAPANEQKASQANAGIDPEGSRRPNAPVQ